MGLGMSKMGAKVAASLVSTVSPELHSDITTSLTNSLSASASTELNADLKAFSDNYLASSSNGNVVVEFGGAVTAVAVVVVHFAATGYVWLLSICLISGVVLAVLTVQQVQSMWQRSEELLLEVTVQTPSELVVQGQKVDLSMQMPKTQAVMTHVLQVPPCVAAKCMEDATCKDIANFTVSCIEAQLSFGKMSMFGGDIQSKKVEAVGGLQLPLHMQGMTMQALSEHLIMQIESERRDVAKSWRSIRNTLSEGVTNLNYHLKNTPGREPVPKETIDRLLNATELQEDLKVLCKDRKETLHQVQIFQQNAYRSKKAVGPIGVLMKQQEEHFEGRQKLVAKKHELAGKLTEEKAKVAKLKMETEHNKSHKRGLQQTLADNESCLEKVRTEISAASQRRRDFTFRWWGRRTEMWVNDKNLAAAEVEDFTKQEAKLKESAESRRAGLDTSTQQVEQASAETSGLLTLHSKQAEDLEEELAVVLAKEHELAQKAAETETKLRSLIAEEGCEDARHVFMVREAVEHYARVMSCAADRAGVMGDTTRSVTKNLELQLLLISNAKSRKEQWRAKDALQQFLAGGSSPVLSMIWKAKGVPESFVEVDQIPSYAAMLSSALVTSQKALTTAETVEEKVQVVD